MKKTKTSLCCLVVAAVLVTSAHAQNTVDNPYALMSARDVKDNALSNITISNHTAQAITIAGLYISSFDVNDCSVCSGSVLGGDNLNGTVVSPLTFKVNQTVPMGQNYLYNMIYNGLYGVRGSISAPCALPGCSWPGDNPSVHGWCLSMNVISRSSSYTYSAYTSGTNPPANTPPFGAAGTSPPSQFNYNYALVNPNTLGVGNACLGPITCDDKTLTCKVDTAQSESFQPY